MINHDTSLYVTSRIVNLIIHYELGNFELLDYLIRSAYIFLKKNKLRGFKEQVVIEFMRKLPGVSSRSQLKGLFEESLNQLKSYHRARKEDVNLSNQANHQTIQSSFTSSAEFDLESWLESKIWGKTFGEIIKQKQ